LGPLEGANPVTEIRLKDKNVKNGIKPTQLDPLEGANPVTEIRLK
jgi:hypothetical protein